MEGYELKAALSTLTLCVVLVGVLMFVGIYWRIHTDHTVYHPTDNTYKATPIVAFTSAHNESSTSYHVAPIFAGGVVNLAMLPASSDNTVNDYYLVANFKNAFYLLCFQDYSDYLVAVGSETFTLTETENKVGDIKYTFRDSDVEVKRKLTDADVDAYINSVKQEATPEQKQEAASEQAPTASTTSTITEQTMTEQSPSDALTHVEKIISKSMEESKDGIRYYIYTEANQKMEVDKDTYNSTSVGDNIVTH